jgi:hypothetical protein
MSQIAQKIQKGYHQTKKRKIAMVEKEDPVETPPGLRRRTKRRNEIGI